MQTFINTQDQGIFSFEDDVVVTQTKSGSYEFSTADGVLLNNLPQTLVPYTVPASVPVEQLPQAQALKLIQLNQTCQNLILGGFVSSALGSTYTYPSKDTDQQNLAASVLASILPGVTPGWTTPFWCADANGNWAFRNHTATQIQQVGIDAKNAILSLQNRNIVAQAAVNAAQSVTEVNAVVF